ncbi:MAG: molybdenum cofactor guanylyltransferase [Chloroflexota bacterium]
MTKNITKRDDLTVAIMAGGKSSRMGRNKSFVDLDGKLMIERVLATVAPLSTHQIIITNSPLLYEPFNLPMFSDLYPDHGPLAGIYTAVHHATTPYILIVATDMPWLNAYLLEFLIQLRQEAEVVVPRWQKFPEPLHAVYSKAVLPAIKQSLDAKKLKIIRFFNEVTVRYVEREEIEMFDKNGRSFANINTPEELKEARKGDGKK